MNIIIKLIIYQNYPTWIFDAKAMTLPIIDSGVGKTIALAVVRYLWSNFLRLTIKVDIWGANFGGPKDEIGIYHRL